MSTAQQVRWKATSAQVPVSLLWTSPEGRSVEITFRALRAFEEQNSKRGRPECGLLLGSNAGGVAVVLDHEPASKEAVVAALSGRESKQSAGQERRIKVIGAYLLEHLRPEIVSQDGVDPVGDALFWRIPPSSPRVVMIDGAGKVLVEFPYRSSELADGGWAPFEARFASARPAAPSEAPRPEQAPVASPTPEPPPSASELLPAFWPVAGTDPWKIELPPARGERGWRAGALALVALIATAFLAAGYWVSRPPGSSVAEAGPPPRTETPSPSDLKVTAQRRGENVEILWDKGAPGIANAEAGLVRIQDQGGEQTFALSAVQLQSSKLIFVSGGGDVSVSLTVLGRNSAVGRGSTRLVEASPRQPAAQSAETQAITLEVRPAEPLRQVRPVAPAAMPKTTYADIDLIMTVGADGTVTGARPRQSGVDPRIVDSAVAAARRWRFKPATRNGSSIGSEYVARFQFGH